MPLRLDDLVLADRSPRTPAVSEECRDLLGSPIAKSIARTTI